MITNRDAIVERADVVFDLGQPQQVLAVHAEL
jgi:hypothetical protein